MTHSLTRTTEMSLTELGYGPDQIHPDVLQWDRMVKIEENTILRLLVMSCSAVVSINEARTLCIALPCLEWE